MRLLYYIIKRLLTSPAILGWGFAYMIFWILMGAYVFSSGMKPADFYNQEIYGQVVNYYTAGYAGVIVLISLGTLSTGITYMLYYQTGGLSHLFRYSKLTPLYYVSSVYIGSIVVSVINGLIMILLTGITFSNRFGLSLYPKNPLLLVAFIILAMVFLTSFSMILNIITLKTSRRMRNFIAYIPLIFAFLFGYGYLFLNMNKESYLSPFTMINTLVMSGYLNRPAPLNYATLTTFNYYSGTPPAIINVSIPYAIFSLLIWTIALTIISIVGIRKLYYKPFEEEREIW